MQRLKTRGCLRLAWNESMEDWDWVTAEQQVKGTKKKQHHGLSVGIHETKTARKEKKETKELG
jgi:outer membrane protease